MINKQIQELKKEIDRLQDERSRMVKILQSKGVNKWCVLEILLVFMGYCLGKYERKVKNEKAIQ